MRADRLDEGLPEFGTGLRSRLSRGAQPEPEPAAEPQTAPTPIRSRTPAPPVDLAQYAVAPQVRDELQQRVEEEAETLWRVFADALAATTASGRPDHRTRLLAARTLLAEIHPGGRVKDELAELRRRRGRRRATG